MDHVLGEIAFRDSLRAHAESERLCHDLPSGIRLRLERFLAASPDPDSALTALSSLRESQLGAFQRIVNSPSGLQYLVAVFSSSRFLTAAVLQRPEWLEGLLSSGEMHRTLATEAFVGRLRTFLGGIEPIPSAHNLAQFRRQQLLRILLRDVLGIATLTEVTEELSSLADAIVEVAYEGIRADLIRRHGRPTELTASGQRVESGFSVIALGKLGGSELNYSSDIDLLFVYSSNGETTGPAPITNKEFFKKVANELTSLLSTYTAEGLCYRVDLRLRPDGKLGEVCLSLDGTRKYYQSRARDWELQMLIKARVAAGEPLPGRELLDAIDPLIYSSTLDFSAVEVMSLTRERLNEKLSAKRLHNAGLDIKLARGGIRDVEFLVQCLQRLHGGRVPWVRHGGTVLALARLRDKDLLSPGEYSRLASAYQFLRHLEHRLQFNDDRQTHTLPSDPAEVELIARRMPAGQAGLRRNRETLLLELNRHLEEVLEIYERVIHAQRPLYYTTLPAVPPAELPAVPEPVAAPSNLVRFLDQRAPDFAASLAQSGLRRGARSFEHFLERAFAEPSRIDALNTDHSFARSLLDVFELSPYLAEELIRTPDLMGVLRESLPSLAGPFSDTSSLRRGFRRSMVSILADSVCRRTPIFETLSRTSELADGVVAEAYRMATEQVAALRPPEASGYLARGQMMVIALGRLGMREFDLGSDADLVFVLPDADTPEMMFWTRVAERTIEIISTYTGEGSLFAVDTRLRPNGREGALVQSETAYQEYFSKHAEAWEGITYMKSRAVAGDVDQATRFLNRLQEVDWRRYGQNGRSKRDLRQMRTRLEREQGSSNPLKAGRGGYYDIDFVLMFLRLKGAGIFFKVLNTPERVDILEKMGHLERADAEFLSEAATFYRAVDHGLRIISGHAEGSLPNSESQRELLTELVRRWTPVHLHQQPLKDELVEIQTRTREIFERLFA